MGDDQKEKQEPPHNGEPINLKQLAAILQLSQTTVSLVLNNSPSAKSIPARTRDRVLQAARKYHYRPNYFARSLRKNRSMSIGVMAPDLSEGYFTMVMNGVNAAAREISPGPRSQNRTMVPKMANLPPPHRSIAHLMKTIRPWSG